MIYLQKEEPSNNNYTKIKNITSLSWGNFTINDFVSWQNTVYQIAIKRGYVKSDSIEGKRQQMDAYYNPKLKIKNLYKIDPSDIQNITINEIESFVCYYFAIQDYQRAYSFLDKLPCDDDHIIFLKLLLIFSKDSRIRRYASGIEISSDYFRRGDDKRLIKLCLKKHKPTMVLLLDIPDLLLTDEESATELLEALIVIKEYVISEKTTFDRHDIDDDIDNLCEKIRFIQSKLNNNSFEEGFPLSYFVNTKHEINSSDDELFTID